MKRNELSRLGSQENGRSGNKEIGEVRKRCYGVSVRGKVLRNLEEKIEFK